MNLSEVSPSARKEGAHGVQSAFAPYPPSPPILVRRVRADVSCNALTGTELQQAWPPREPTEHQYEWTQPSSPWTYEETNGLNPTLVPSNTQLRSRKPAGASALPPYHPDYEPPDDDDDDDGERYAEYERARVRRGSEGYEVRAIDREGLLAEFIASRAQEEGRYRRYVPEPPSEPDSESSWEEEGGIVADGGGGVREDVIAAVDDEEDEPLAVRVEKWRTGKAIA